MLIKEQIKKFIDRDQVSFSNDGEIHFLKVPSYELPICVVNTTKFAYANKDYIKTIASLHTVPRALVKETFIEWLQSKFNNELKDVVFISTPLYKYIVKLEIPFPN